MNFMVLGGSGMFGRKTVLHMIQDKEIDNVVSVDIAPPPEWALKEYEPFRRMIYQGKGAKVRAMFDRNNLPYPEQAIRNRIKRAKLWMR